MARQIAVTSRRLLLFRFGCDIDVIRNSVIRSCSGLSIRSTKEFSTAADQRCVKFRLGFERRHQIAFGERGLQFGECIPDPANDGGVAQARAFASGKSFENGASRVELSCFLKADGADHGAAMGNGVDQAICLQQPQRLADRRPAHAGHLAKLAFDQALSRLERSRHDGFAQFLRDHRADGWNVLDPERRFCIALLSIVACFRPDLARCFSHLDFP